MGYTTIGLMIICSYLLGSLPTGYWLVKALKSVDIRQYGSGSTGATNVWRCAGKGAGISVFIIDLLKGVLAVWAALSLEGQFYLDQYRLAPVAMALAALIGHSRSIFLKFQGGKGAATGLGTLLALQPMVGFATFLTWLCLIYIGRIVSLASIVATGLCSIYMALSKAPSSYVVYCLVGFAYVTWCHKANIVRIIKGVEPRLGQNPTLHNKQPHSQGKPD